MLPSGTVTFLFTDIEGSTKLSQLFPEKLQASLDKHHSIMNNVIESHNGKVFEIVGDAFCCAFSEAEDAVNAAIEAQIKLSKTEWNEVVIKVRMGIHSGKVEVINNKYSGYIILARSSRVMSAAYGEQILISEDTFRILESGKNDFAFRDLGERRLKDVIQPIRLYQVMANGIRGDFPPLKTLDARPNNLPVQLSSFIGREDEIREIKKLMKKSRIITLIGSGGSGKTRLALQISADLIDEFDHGVWLAELAPLTDDDQIQLTIMKALKIPGITDESHDEVIIEFIKNKKILIIFDNCEHLIHTSAVLSEKLLSSCPNLRIIATSREALKCSGEQIFKIPSLKIPDSRKNSSADEIINYESARLFIERALTVNPGFRLTDENAKYLSQICIKLDGIPLALELAAARIKILSLDKILDKLNDKFRLLTGGLRTALPRQQTLKAAISWSYDLLPDEERSLWNKLTVFASGFTSDAAEEVCSDENTDSFEILNLLENLHEKSILTYDDVSERYRMLETIREFGKEFLASSGQSESFHLKHLDYFLRFAETNSRLLIENTRKEILEKLETEFDNFETALSFSLNCGMNFECLRIVKALSLLWIIRGYSYTGNKWVEILLKKENEFTEEQYYIVLKTAGNLKTHFGDYVYAMRNYERCMELSIMKEDKREITIAYNNLGIISARMGDYKRAKSLFTDHLSLLREEGNEKSIMIALNNLSLLEIYLGEFDSAKKHTEESLQIGNSIENKYDLYFSYRNSGKLEYSLKNFRESDAFHSKALELARKTGYVSGIAVSLSELALAKTALKDYTAARKLLSECIRESEHTDEKICIAMVYSGLAELEYNCGNFPEAKDNSVKSLKFFEEINDKTGLVGSLKLLGKSEFKLNNHEEAKSILSKCLRLKHEMGMYPEIPDLLIDLSEVYTSLNDPEFAYRTLGVFDSIMTADSRSARKDLLIRFEECISMLKINFNEQEYKELFDNAKIEDII